MEAEKTYNLPPVSWRLRENSGVIQSKTEGLRMSPCSSNHEREQNKAKHTPLCMCGFLLHQQQLHSQQTPHTSSAPDWDNLESEIVNFWAWRDLKDSFWTLMLQWMKILEKLRLDECILHLWRYKVRT